MSDSTDSSNSCPKCGAALPSEATDGLCPNCLMNEALQPTQVSDASKPRHSPILAPESLAPLFPQYEILRMLGRGGMGAVYLARQISLNRLVAIKILPADLGDSDQGFAERFKNEAQAMAQLSHPGIVAVFDFGQTSNGLLFIVMEYIEGTDVQLMLASQGRLHSAHAMAITAHVCDALQYAHSCGIIHRDIKPSNIMVGNNGVVKVADFGLAKMSQGQTTGLTQSGMAMGTPHFMAPEALTLGSAVDQRADIYAVGVMLYQMLTGKLPQGMFEMPSFQVPGLDPRYDRIVARALRDDREQRYQAAAELRHDLDAILTQPVEKTAQDAETEVKALPPVEQRGRKKARVPSMAPPQAASPAPVRKNPVAMILTVLGVTAVLIAAFVYFRDHGARPITRELALATKEQPFLDTLGAFDEHWVDGLAAWRRDAKTHEGFVRDPDGSARCVLPSPVVQPLSKEAMLFDQSVRATVRLNGGWLHLMLRCSRDGVGFGNHYKARLDARSRRIEVNTATFSMTGGKVVESNRLLADIPLSVDVDWEAAHRLEFRIVGDMLSIGFDGKRVWEGKDDEFASGQPAIGPVAGVVIERFEYLDLGRSSATPSVATKEAPFTNTLGMKFVPVPITGGPTDGKRVLFSIWETRLQDYEVFVKETQHEWAKPNFGQEASHPVVNMSWDDAQAFCRWLTEREQMAGRIAADERYRLPHDHEWSCAVGIGDREDATKTPAQKNNQITDLFPWGAIWPPPQGAGNYADESAKAGRIKGGDDYLTGYQDGFTWTAPVGSFAANPFGLYDLGGNAHELSEDPWQPGQPNRTGRGGSYNMSSPRHLLQLSNRSNDAPDKRISDRGFRCVLESSATSVSPSPALPVASSSTAATKEAPFTNTLGMKFVPVPGTNVLFCIHETRKVDYATFAKTAPGLDDGWEKPADRSVSPAEAGNHPVVNVNEADAQAFCAWLGSKDGLVYRLPTDHEWSYAVGIGDREDVTMSPKNKAGKIQKVYPWGAEWPPPAGAGNFADSFLSASTLKVTPRKPIEGYTDGYAGTAPVMSFRPNNLGIYDLAGNVWEPCSDWFDSTQTTMTVRGGCWDNAPEGDLLSCSRLSKPTEARNSLVGFRVVVERRTLPASSSPSLPDSQSSSTATKDAPFINTLGMKFVPVPITGGPTDGKRVLFSIWQTRVQDYEVFVKETQREWPKPNFEQDPAHPAININWVDAKAFCSWMTDHERKAGRLGANEVYRLPSDHEWSCAAGIGEYEDAKKLPMEKHGQIQGYIWGNRATPPDHFGNFADTAFHEKFPDEPWVEGYSDGYATTSPVGSFQANARGLYDMSGNAWQWCEDFTEVSTNRHVMRGCAFSGGRFVLSFRKSDPATTRFDHGDFGFRCVLAAAVDTVSASPSLPGSKSSTSTATKEAPFINTLGMKFVPVPITGGPTDKQGVLFSVWETRVQDYEVFVEETKREWPYPDLEQGPTHPAVNISWDDAQLFCQWLSRREQTAGRLAKDWCYRLATDHEWSCAVGVGGSDDVLMLPIEKNRNGGSIYPWGKSWPPPAGAGNYAGEEMRERTAAHKANIDPDDREVIAGYRDDFVGTAPAGSFLPNQFGLFDLGGNAGEWCADWYDKKHKTRVIRGSSWGTSAQNFARSTNRADQVPGFRHRNHGFRCVVAPVVSPSPSLPDSKSAAAPAATKDAPFINTLGMKFVPVPITGGPTNKQQVLFSIWETRVQDFGAFAKETKHEWLRTDFMQAETHPAVKASWEDAQAFCAWLTEKERKAGKLSTNARYRLPTDHEWSCAAVIGEKEDAGMTPAALGKLFSDAFPWGTGWPPPAGAGNYAGEEMKPAVAAGTYKNIKVIDAYRDGFVETAPAGSFLANRFGLHDLGGNAWEWCEDWYDEQKTQRVQRGGSWLNGDHSQTLLATRGKMTPDTRNPNVGFRIVLELPAP